MSTASITTLDKQVRDRVLAELAWDTLVDAGAIGVAAKSGAVTLTGFINTYAEKLAAERAAKRVRGVRAVANDVQVRLRLDRTDEDIAADAARELLNRPALPEDIQAVVHSGQVTLTGHARSVFQRNTVERALRHIPGITRRNGPFASRARCG
jgi:osmotically-inducible protein OsmY